MSTPSSLRGSNVTNTTPTRRPPQPPRSSASFEADSEIDYSRQSHAAAGGGGSTSSPVTKRNKTPSPAGRKTPSTNVSFGGESSEAAAAGNRSTALTTVLEQMDQFFRADNSERQMRLKVLEERQRELQRLVEDAKDHQEEKQQEFQPTNQSPSRRERTPEEQQQHHQRSSSRYPSASQRTALLAPPSPPQYLAAAGSSTNASQDHHLIHNDYPAAHDAADINNNRNLAAEVDTLTAQCNTSMNELVEEARAATEEAAKVRAVNEKLVAQMEEKDAKVASLNTKMEQLARNVVKAIRERNHFEDLVADRDEKLLDAEKMLAETKAKNSSHAETSEELSHVKSQLMAKTKEIAIAHEENAKLAGLLEKATTEARQIKRELQTERDTIIAQITEQLADTVVERDEAVAAVSEAQSVNERLAEELQNSIRHMKLLDEKLAAADRTITTERTSRMALEREVTAFKGAQGVAPYGINQAPFQNAETTSAIREEVGRLQSLLDGALLENAEHSRRAEARIASTTALNQQLTERCKSHEAQITELRKELAQIGRERTHATLGAQKFRNMVSNIQQDAAATSEVIMTTRSDAEEAVANAQDDLSLRFAQQARSDFASIAQFFAALRRLDTTSVAGGGVVGSSGAEQQSQPQMAQAATTSTFGPSSMMAQHQQQQQQVLAAADNHAPQQQSVVPMYGVIDSGGSRSNSASAAVGGAPFHMSERESPEIAAGFANAHYPQQQQHGSYNPQQHHQQQHQHSKRLKLSPPSPGQPMHVVLGMSSGNSLNTDNNMSSGVVGGAPTTRSYYQQQGVAAGAGDGGSSLSYYQSQPHQQVAVAPAATADNNNGGSRSASAAAALVSPAM